MKKKINLRPIDILETNIYVIIILTFFHSLSAFYIKSGGILSEICKFFSFDRENNIPSIYSALIVLISGLLCLLISRFKEIRLIERIYWFFLGLIFSYLSLDEWKSIHEKINIDFKSFTNISIINIDAFPSWIVPYSAFIIFFIVAFYKVIFNLPKRTFKLIFIAFIMYLTGSIFFELLSTLPSYISTLDSLDRINNFQYFILHTLEELFEMLAINIFIYALIDYVNRFRKIIIGSELNSKCN
tara:strand:- start:223 stop:951 length:729 start_codon:yes stop_codon:yes gene_type:complete